MVLVKSPLAVNSSALHVKSSCLPQECGPYSGAGAMRIHSYARALCDIKKWSSSSSSIRYPLSLPGQQQQRTTCGTRRSRAPLHATCGIAEPSGKPAPMGQKTRYSDTWFDLAFMALFAQKMERLTGKKSELEGYEGFVDISRKVMQGRTPKQQQDATLTVLMSMLPPNGPATFRKLFPPTKWSAEINATITSLFFPWLVGPCKVVEAEVNGVKQMSGVKIEKCRYLENSGCVGMCVNMCKLPTQHFFTNEFGLPLTMTPNFEDMSCEMVFGQPPPPPEEDPAFKQPCFDLICTVAVPKREACPKLVA